MGTPLAGIRVAEMAGIGPAPFGVMLLADLGAEVIRVDRIQQALDGPASWGVGLARGRRSIAVDLKQPAGAALARKLVSSCDVVVESFRPGVMERLGLGPDEFADNPGLIYARMSGWGQSGPLASAAGHDLNYIAIAGALYNLGYPDRPPLPPQAYLGDFGGGGTFLALGVLAALFERATSGHGQVIDAAVFDGVVALTAFSHGLAALGEWGPRGTTIADGSVPYYSCYATSDDQYVAVAAIEPPFYDELLRTLELSAATYPQQDPRAWSGLRAELSRIFASRTREEWTRRFDGIDACVTPVLRLDEVAGHPHSVARGSFTDVGGLTQPTPAPRLSRTPATAAPPSSAPGADSEAVALSLGWTAKEVRELLAAGVLATADGAVSGCGRAAE
jgi:alpha-methylacyl-CoA racemase